MLGLLAVLALSGCFGGHDREVAGVEAIADCRLAPTSDHVYYFGPGPRLQDTVPPAGFAPGNAFSSGFLTNDLKEWLSDPVPEGLWLVGNVTLEFWARSTGTPAPLMLGDEPGTGYHFFNQFGSDRSFQPASAVEYADAIPMEGQVDHYVEALAMPQGGFVIERGDRVRVLLTDLALDDGAGGTGHDILFGGQTPSQVRFTAKCWKDVRWDQVDGRVEAVSLPGNQGLLFVPGDVRGTTNQEGVNYQDFPFTVPDGVERVSIRLEQGLDPDQVKDDVDIDLLDTAGQVAWQIGSPYSDEAGALWLDNLEAYFPGHYFTVRVNSYSGIDYSGTLTVTFESARA
jgi:hypothetical protein